MKKIASFTINHDILCPGMYLSRVDGDVRTYDIRMTAPNSGDYLDMDAAHTIEHLFATYVRNSPLAGGIIYVGPMGCRTGFYFLTRESVSHAQAIELIRETFGFIAAYQGEVPGATTRECGNAAGHNLNAAREAAARYLAVIEGWTEDRLRYPD